MTDWLIEDFVHCLVKHFQNIPCDPIDDVLRLDIFFLFIFYYIVLWAMMKS